MDQLQTNPIETVFFYLIVLVALALVPSMLTWWLLAQHANNRRRRAGVPAGVGRWNLRRFGPAAPLTSAGAFLIGFLICAIPDVRDTLHPTLVIGFFLLASFGLVALMMSMVLWSYSNVQPGNGEADQ